MTAVQKLVFLGLAVILLLAVGASGGAWLTSNHYRPLLDIAGIALASTSAARNNLRALADEQGKKLSELVQAGEPRARNTSLAQEKAKQEALLDYAASNQLLRDRMGGNPAQAAAAIIDQELGL